MSEVLTSLRKKGNGASSVRELIYDKVFNEGLPEITTLTPYANRVLITEGKIVADSVKHKVYAYVDMTISVPVSATNWVQLITLQNTISNYLPIYVSNSRNNNLPLITDDNSDKPTHQFFLGYGDSSNPYRLAGAYQQSTVQGDHFILYTEYTYK